MGRSVERYKTFEGMILGYKATERKPLELTVSRVHLKDYAHGVVIDGVPFSAFTTRVIDQLCESSGIRLRGDIMIPWDRLEERGDLVLVRQDLTRPQQKPVVLLESLVNIRPQRSYR